MAKITFKAKVQEMDPFLGGYQYVTVPKLERRHCDMHAFRIHPKFGSYANSDLFPNILARQREALFGSNGRLRLDAIPENVTVDTSGFLAVVTIEL
jgi:hypothetical protein